MFYSAVRIRVVNYVSVSRAADGDHELFQGRKLDGEHFNLEL